MKFDHVFIRCDLISLICARMIQLKTTDSILLLHENAEIGMPTEACGLFSNPNIFDKLLLEPFPNSLCISLSPPFALRSEWLEKHLAIVLAKNGTTIATRAILEITNPNTGIISGSSIMEGKINFHHLHNIEIPPHFSKKWYGYIHTKPFKQINNNSGLRKDTSYETWSDSIIQIPSTVEVRKGIGSEISPNTIDIIMEMAQSYFDEHISED